ncbi:hypothetical protein [Methanobacterium aggregans]|nr:hypothetical protein [Methanobacterium aggregans]MBP2045813.1 hypothetical protein [Methanobacterium aggregans]
MNAFKVTLDMDIRLGMMLDLIMLFFDTFFFKILEKDFKKIIWGV